MFWLLHYSYKSDGIICINMNNETNNAKIGNIYRMTNVFAPVTCTKLLNSLIIDGNIISEEVRI